MAPTTRAAKKAALERENPPPSLPPELWHLIFLQNTNPKHLWTVGRQVCSMWRSEIPKVIAKKYLEDPKMTQIHSDCEITGDKNVTCLMGSVLIFSHYQNKTRAVFKGRPEQGGHEKFCIQYRETAREKKSRSLDGFLIEGATCDLCFGKPTSPRCDLPPCQIRIKGEANDTELPNLEADFANRAVSFEWQGMLEMFFREAAVLGRCDEDIATEALQWLDREKPSMARVMLRAWNDHDARRERRKEVRRDRIKRRDNEIHPGRHTGSFDTEFERKVLQGFQELESPKIDPTEDKEEEEMKKEQRGAERELENVQGCMHSDALEGDEERYLALWWEGQLRNLPRKERESYSERYAKQ
jgi:hypothetical protein